MKQRSDRDINVVIVGAGFGGLSTVKQLANKNINVSLIDQHNYHLFQPLLYQVATAALTPAGIATPIRHVFRCAKNIAVYIDTVNAVDSGKRQLVTEGRLWFDYDYLILATGARHSYFGRDERVPLAPGLKTIDDTFELRQCILTAFEKAEMAEDQEERQSYLNFVIVGAGPTGVEMTSAIAELARYTLAEDFRHITPECARIILVNAGPRFLATIGRNQAITDLGFAKFSVFIGWWLWGFAHIYYLIGYRSHLFVGRSWFWAYLSYQLGVRLITGTSSTRREQK